MLQTRTNQICLEFAFWATSPPAVHGGIYELRTYELKVIPRSECFKEPVIVLNYGFRRSAWSSSRVGNLLVRKATIHLLVGLTFAYLLLYNRHKGLECRRQFCEPVGAWFSQLGALNYVHHMWQYP
jgi:hypothetical protein